MDINPKSKGKYVETYGLNIYYEDYGQGEPLILLHGGTINGHFNWNIPGITSILAEHYHVFIPDSRGHGKTKNPAGNLSFTMMADDVAAFTQSLGLEKPIIGGWSDGGQISMILGMRHPEIPKGLILGSAMHRFTNQFFNALTSWGLTSEIDFDTAEKTPFFGRNMDVWKEIYGEDLWRERLSEIVQMYWAPQNYTSADFQEIIVPTMVLMGDRDENKSVDIGVEMYQMLPHGELAIVPNMAHNFPWAYPQLFAQLILDFCGRCHGEGGKFE